MAMGKRINKKIFKESFKKFIEQKNDFQFLTGARFSVKEQEKAKKWIENIFNISGN